MKKLLLSALAAFCFGAVQAQTAVLPTSYDWATGSSMPVGWTTTGTGLYTGSGAPGPAIKFDSSGDSLTIHFSGTPGALTYDLAGNSFSGGTFLVEESVNGSAWTTLRTFTAPPAGTYTAFSDSPNPNSRYIRFNYQNKVAGNIGMDNVSIAAGVSTTQQMNVKVGTVTFTNGSTYTTSSGVGVTTPIVFTVENNGTVGTLNVSAASLTGAHASDFAIVTSVPFSVAPSSSLSFTVNFTPSAVGTRSAVLSFTNDDPTANPYVINLYGIGGGLATEPASQPTALTFTYSKTYRVRGTFTASTALPEGYLILKKIGGPVTDVPADGVEYQRGDIVGSSRVISSNSNTFFVPNGIEAATNYHFAVFAYNGNGTYRNYLTTSPLTGNTTTPATMMPASYYTGISTASPSFITDLHNKINPHTLQFYSNYGPYMVSKFYARDTVDNKKVVTCVYSGENWVYNEPWDWATNDFSREHTFPHSWHPTYTDPGSESLPQYNDYHMLEPTDQNEANAIRSNYPLGEVVAPTYTFLGCKLGNDASGKKVFEPRDAHKGNVARCIMYTSVCYTGVSGDLWNFPTNISATIPYGQDQNVLKMWHYQDPPDNLEIARNDYVDSLQGNRNPFIDSAQFACYIDFTTMTKIASPAVPCATVGIADQQVQDDLIMLMPNPNNGSFVLGYTSPVSQQVTMRVYDMLGKVVFSSVTNVVKGANKLELSVDGLRSGIYNFEFLSEKGRITEKLVIQ